MENKEKTSLIKRLLPYTKGFRLPFILALICAVISSWITVYGPDIISDITNTISDALKNASQIAVYLKAGNIKEAMGVNADVDTAKVAKLAWQLVVLYSVGALVSYYQQYTFTTIIQKFSNRMRKAIAEKINRVPLAYFDSHTQGDTLSRVTNDVDIMAQSLQQSLGTIFSSSILLIAAIIMMIETNGRLAAVAILSVLIGFIITMVIIASSQPLFKRQQKNLSNVSGYVEEIYSGHNVVKSYSATDEVKEQFKNLNNALYKSMWQSQFFSGIMMPLMQFIGNFGYVMVCVFGAIWMIDGKVSMGTIVAFMIYVRIFSQPLSQLAQAFGQLQQASAGMNRVFEFLEEDEMEEESNKTKQLDTIKGDVTFEHVHFGYSKDKTIIHDFSAHAQAGQKIAIVGPTGAGKTTLVNLLMRFYEVDSGTISIDGVNVHDMKREEVHDAFSMVLQDTWLFEGTIKENLIYNQKGITDEQVEAAAKAVGVHHFIKTLPNGYDSVLDDSLTLSVGQKQLLTIARALLKDAPLLILDEATSSVDTRTEELIQKAMDKLMEGRTSFVIAHRLSTIKNADLILVMKDGNIIEQGNHDVLMAQNGFYADLYNSQFEEN
ncbi:MAG: ABC transporter ATP-binding protein [Streptococcus hyointestinalis]|uniref:ABC transporter ATP-binding protein n=1 Tax=Streptococcus hyointestinalis TaxID=1337 RepID=UPI0023F04FDC|nr:ABC transporter ATP-binding protein [Streptococcus hyointestinalis]MCI6871642.1 ABC transporter ATP-binding protein/permease [Streptococcus hyointestinalis]MDD7356668.1 ABC transporter ATP-binding protein [Streptococcus hyointestinalis]MDY4553140.1 ABC transporter ATP-binding protein [Streptococcus hyointestinalis]